MPTGGPRSYLNVAEHNELVVGQHSGVGSTQHAGVRCHNDRVSNIALTLAGDLLDDRLKVVFFDLSDLI